jgi:hypothetical protein
MRFGIPITLYLLSWSKGIKLAYVMQFLRDTGMNLNIRVAAHARNFIFVASKPIPRLFFCISRHKPSTPFVSPIIRSNRSRLTTVKEYLYFFPRNCLCNFPLSVITLTFNGGSFLLGCSSYPADGCVLPQGTLSKIENHFFSSLKVIMLLVISCFLFTMNLSHGNRHFKIQEL